MRQLVNNDQSSGLANIDIAGIAKYAVADYGDTWATTATIDASLADLFENPINGDIAVLFNTNATGGGGRLYAYANDAWHYAALT